MPVLVNVIGEMAENVDQYRLGTVVSSAEAIPDALRNLDSKDCSASERCQLFFDEKLAFDRIMQPLLERIDRICGISR